MKNDLTGKRFGRLTVLEEADPIRSKDGKLYRRWLCRCDCGTVKPVRAQTLLSKNNPTRSCGCARSETLRAGAKKMTGLVYGRLTVLGPADLERVHPNGLRLGWLCRCECDTEFVATRKDLESGKLKSCGCLLREAARKRMVVDNVSGRFMGTTITEIQPTRGPNRNNKSGVKGVYWSEKDKRWIAKIGVQGRSIRLGYFNSLDAAAKARRAAEEKYYTPLIDAYNAAQKEPPDD